MKKFLLGFAFIASLAFMLTSCPSGGSKAKNSVSGSITIDADTGYDVNSDLKITIKLEDGSKFKAITNANLSGESAWVTITPKVEANKLNGKFVLKDAVAADATTFDLYYTLALTNDVKTENPALNNAEYKVTISKDAIKDAEKDVELSDVFKVTVKSRAVVNNDAVVGFKLTPEEKTGDTVTTAASIATTDVTINLKGYTFKALALPTEAEAETGNANWFGSDIIGCVKEAVEEGAKSATITLKLKDSVAKAVSTNAVLFDLSIPDTATNKAISGNGKYFVYCPGGDAATAPSAIITGNITAEKGKAIAAQDAILTLKNTVVLNDIKAGESIRDAFVGYATVMSAGTVVGFGENNGIDVVLKDDVKAGDKTCTITFQPTKKDDGSANVVSQDAARGVFGAMIPGEYVFGVPMGSTGTYTIALGYDETNTSNPISFTLTITDSTAATLADKSITGVKGTALAASDATTITLTLPADYKIKSDIAADTNVKSWVKIVTEGTDVDLPDYLTASVAETKANATSISIKFSITDANKDAITDAISGYLKVIVPADKLSVKGQDGNFADATGVVTSAPNQFCGIDITIPTGN